MAVFILLTPTLSIRRELNLFTILCIYCVNKLCRCNVHRPAEFLTLPTCKLCLHSGLSGLSLRGVARHQALINRRVIAQQPAETFDVVAPVAM